MTTEPPTEPQFLQHAGDSTRILSKHRQLFDIKEKYAEEKAAYDDQVELLQAKEDALAKRDLEFQARLVRLKNFAKENELKTEKLTRRLADEVKACEDLDRQAAALTKTLNEKRHQLKELQATAHEAKLHSLDEQIETQTAELEQLQVCDESNSADSQKIPASADDAATG